MVHTVVSREKGSFALIASVIFVALIVVGAAVYYYEVIAPQSSRAALNPGLSAGVRHDIYALEKIDEIEAKLAAGVAPGEEAAQKQVLAAALVAVGKIEEGYTLLREVAENPAYTNTARALAVQQMGDIFFERTEGNPKWAEKFIFTEEPYASMLDPLVSDEAKRAWAGIRSLYEYANSLAPSPVNEYRIAEWLVHEGEYEEAEKHLDAGTALLPAYLESLPAYNLEGNLHALRGLVAGALGAATSDEAMIAEARSAFEEARESLTTDGVAKNIAAAGALVWVDFYYASFLSKVGSEEDSAFIAGLLRELVKSVQVHFAFNRYVVRSLAGSHLVGTYRDEANLLKELGEREPVFAAYIASLVSR